MFHSLVSVSWSEGEAIVIQMTDVETDSSKACDYDNPDVVVVDIHLVMAVSPFINNFDKLNITAVGSMAGLLDQVWPSIHFLMF